MTEAIAALTTPAPLLQERQTDAIEQKAKQFEAVMLTEMLKPMFENKQASHLFGGDETDQSIFGSMLQEKYAEAIAERGGIGIADQVKAALIAMQAQSYPTEGMNP